MIEWLESIDRSIVLTVNSWHTPVLDEIFWFISARWPWIPLYLILLFLSWLHFGKRKTVLFVGIVIATIIVADLTSVYLFKEFFQRYRPSHNTLLTHKLHFYQLEKDAFYKGGLYGFVSSHATNFGAITVLIGLSLSQSFPKLIWILVGISALIAFSRIYLGVHYLSDIIAGTIWGGTLAYLSYRFVVKPLVINPVDKSLS